MRAPSVVVAGLGLLLVVPACAGTLASGASGASGATTGGTSRLLTAPAHGRAAVEALGPDLDLAAGRSGMGAGTLRALLAADRTAWVDETGHLFYVEPDQAAAVTAPATEAAAYPYAASFTLHSRPAATRKVYLDFDGYRVQSSAWNDVTHPVIDVAAYTMDADAAFSQAELDVVQEVWARVAEDYAPFDVDVTTEDPGTAALVRTSVDDAAYGMRASVTTDPDMRTVLCSGSCAGVAYVGVFDSVMGSSGPGYQPAFALPKTTYTAAQVAEIVSHEVGHTLGLGHDGLNGSAYYQDGTGTKIWSPIMGAGYTPLTQFSNGDYSGATQTQDDLAVIAQHGPAVIGDDYGNTVGAAFPLGTGDATAAGLVTSRTDVDVFAISRPCVGTLTASVTPAPLGPGLDTQLRLLDASGGVVAVSAPATARAGTWSPVLTGMGASISQSLAAGSYYLEVDGVGLADASLGYSDYGSVGRYTLAATGCADSGTPGPSPSPSPSPSPAFTEPITGPITDGGGHADPDAARIGHAHHDAADVRRAGRAARPGGQARQAGEPAHHPALLAAAPDERRCGGDGVRGAGLEGQAVRPRRQPGEHRPRRGCPAPPGPEAARGAVPGGGRRGERRRHRAALGTHGPGGAALVGSVGCLRPGSQCRSRSSSPACTCTARRRTSPSATCWCPAASRTSKRAA